MSRVQITPCLTQQKKAGGPAKFKNGALAVDTPIDEGDDLSKNPGQLFCLYGRTGAERSSHVRTISLVWKISGMSDRRRSRSDTCGRSST
jgi:hypothetical protein